MDKHLNLFYSYNQGNLNDTERIKQLEDNLTRSLISTLLSLDSNMQKRFLEMLVEDNVRSKHFSLDLQNTLKYNKSENTLKYVIILQRDRSSIRIEDFFNFDLDVISSMESDHTAIKQIKASLKQEEDLNYNGIIIAYKYLLSLLNSLSGNRPDAWIIGEYETFLIESKIGGNSVSNYQIFRHVTGKNGLQIKASELKQKPDNIKIINVSWEDTCKYLLDLDKENYIINQYCDYITMTGQKLDFNYIINDQFDYDVHKEQMNLFLNLLDKALMNQNSEFIREKRNKAGLWESYSIKDDNGKFCRDPHYTVGFWNNSISIYLTTLKLNQIDNQLAEGLKKYINEKKKSCGLDLSRYYLRQNNYKLVDYQKGQIRGEFQEPFQFFIKFSEIGRNADKISTCLVDFSKMKLYKQFELGLSIEFFDFSKIRAQNQNEQIRHMNKRILEKPELLVSSFVEFMNETKYLFNEMKN